MSLQETEQERIQRIRSEQIKARDPLEKDRRVSRKVTARRRVKRKNEKFIMDSIKDVPYVFRGGIIGLILGFVVILILPYFFEENWVFLVSLVVTIILVVIGTIFGASLDWRDDIRDF
ncbi:MAG: hypothetical protein FVQ83_11280 [Chloroflexi bacterium]|nr:hypothetical protein [Chloroflexota bacterium]